MFVYDDFVDTVVFVVTVVVFLVVASFCVLVFLTKLTPVNRLALTDSCVRSLRAAAYRQEKKSKNE